MKHHKTIAFLLFCTALAAVAASAAGIFSSGGPGVYTYTSIRDHTIAIYGKGLYQHMSAEVALQGMAQDYVTLLLAVPLLLLSYFKAKGGALRWRFLLTGTAGYFMVTYIFYLLMGMYNALFLVYTLLAGSSFYLFLLLVRSFNVESLFKYFSAATPVKATGGFLMFNALCIGLLWLSVVVPPLLDGTLIPRQVDHYTTLVVQGLDLAILLPAAFVAGLLLVRKNKAGYLWAPVYFVFLSLLMTALSAKVAAMALQGYPVIPVIFIIPALNVISIVCIAVLLKNCKTKHALQPFK